MPPITPAAHLLHCLVRYVAAVFALLLAALDVRELPHQRNGSRNALAALALLAAARHVGAAAAAGLVLIRRGR